jgi:hypothetical protein
MTRKIRLLQIIEDAKTLVGPEHYALTGKLLGIIGGGIADKSTVFAKTLGQIRRGIGQANEDSSDRVLS